MKLRTRIAPIAPIALAAVLSLGLAACAGDDPEQPAATTGDEMTEDMTDDEDMGDDMTEDEMTDDES